MEKKLKDQRGFLPNRFMKMLLTASLIRRMLIKKPLRAREKEAQVTLIIPPKMKNQSQIMNKMMPASGKNKWSTHLSLELKFINTWKKNGEKVNRKIKGSCVVVYYFLDVHLQGTLFC